MSCRAPALAVVVVAASCVLAVPARGDGSPVLDAEALLGTLANEQDPVERFRIADHAIELCQKAIVARPKDPLPHLVLSRALTIGDLQHPESCRPGACQRAVDELKRARVLDVNGIEAQRIASELGIVLSRVGAYADALAEYDRALTLIESERRPNILDDGGDKAVLYGNSAETLMALGRLGEAIDRYRLAEAAASPPDEEWQLAEWGLAVALDRDEQVEKARAAVARALELNPNMSRLSQEGVFFEPAGDKFYYEALGHEVAGDRKEAAQAWRDYLAAQPTTRWARRARAHLEALKKAPTATDAADALAEVSFDDPIVLHGTRTPEQIGATVSAHLGDVRLCVTHALRGRKHAAERTVVGKLKIKIEITWYGYPMPHAETVDLDAIDDADLVRCVERVAVSWRFVPVERREDLDLVVLPFKLGHQP